MPRYDDDEYDRPRSRDSSSKGLLLVLGLVGGALLLMVVGCLGIFGWGMFQGAKAFKQATATLAGEMAGEAFLSDLQAGRSAAAYQGTTANFKASLSPKQWDELLARNPILTKHEFRSMRTMNQVAEQPAAKVVVSFDLHAKMPEDMEDEDDPDQPRPKPKAKPAAKKVVELKDGVCTLTLIEENGIWKVDAITVP